MNGTLVCQGLISLSHDAMAIIYNLMHNPYKRVKKCESEQPSITPLKSRIVCDPTHASSLALPGVNTSRLSSNMTKKIQLSRPICSATAAGRVFGPLKAPNGYWP